jgi:hypothetical protein
MGIKDVGEWKAYAIEGFKGILELTMKSSLQTPVTYSWLGSRKGERGLEHSLIQLSAFSPPSLQPDIRSHGAGTGTRREGVAPGRKSIAIPAER